jgi:hypothetical protein
MWDFVMDKNGAGAGFLRELGRSANSLTNQIKKNGA